MSKRVLVAYATKYGSTAEVAERIGGVLSNHGVSVEVRPAADVADVSAFDAVVIGAPFYIGKLLKDATAFLERHRSALESRRVALFTLGPATAEDDLDDARHQMDDVLAKHEWLKPASAEMFVGKFDPALLRGLDKLVTKPKASPLYGMGAHDDRDWAAIEAWAASLPAALGLD